VPVIPGYTVYSQIRYRDASNVTLSTQQVAPQVISGDQAVATGGTVVGGNVRIGGNVVIH